MRKAVSRKSPLKPRRRHFDFPDPSDFSEVRLQGVSHRCAAIYGRRLRPTQVLRYLGRYTHRVAISNHRLSAFDGEHVVFRWKDYARGNKQRKMRLNAIEFLRRFVQHVLPRGFVRIRQYGFLANRFQCRYFPSGFRVVPPVRRCTLS